MNTHWNKKKEYLKKDKWHKESSITCDREAYQR
jgi:hypothetical protein